MFLSVSLQQLFLSEIVDLCLFIVCRDLYATHCSYLLYVSIFLHNLISCLASMNFDTIHSDLLICVSESFHTCMMCFLLIHYTH